MNRAGRPEPTAAWPRATTSQSGVPPRMPHPDAPSPMYAPHGARIAMDEAMAAALNHLGEGVAVLDMETYRLLYVNEALCTILGYEVEALLGLPSFVALVDVQDGDQLTQQVDRHRELTQGEAFQLAAFRADGARIRLEVSAKPFDGPVVGPRVLVAVVRDVTEKHAAAEKLRTAHEELESRVRERTQKMREAIHARDDFLSMASHELRTPMTPLQLEVQAAMRTLRAAPDHVDRAAMLEAMSRVDRRVRRMVKTIDDMLDVSHLKGGHVALDLQRCDLGTIARDAVARLDGPATPITVRGEASVIGQWDPVRLAQIVTNLVTNAARYGAGQPVDVSVRSDPHRVSVTVTDRGPGIAPEDHQRIFEPFERAGDDPLVCGFGLGLWTARRLVEAHRGTVHVTSARGEGARFTVELPRDSRSTTA